VMKSLHSDAGDIDYSAMKSKIRVQRYWKTRLFDEVMKKINEHSNDDKGRKLKLLDIGCGSGHYASYIQKNFENIEVTAADANESCLEFLRNMNKDVKCFRLDCNSPKDFKKFDTKFDIILLIEVIEHLEKPKQVIENVKRIMNKNGILIVATPNSNILWKITNFCWSKTLSKRDYTKQHVNEFRFHEIEKLLRSAGFDVIDKKTLFVVTPFIAMFSEKYGRFMGLERRLEGLHWGMDTILVAKAL